MYIVGAEFQETSGFLSKNARCTLVETRNGLIAAVMGSHADGGTARGAVLLMLAENREPSRDSVHKQRLAVSERPPQHPTTSTCKTSRIH